MPFWQKLATRAGAVLDDAVVRVIGAAMQRSAPQRPPRRADVLLERLAEVYDQPRHFDEPATFYRPPAPARMEVLHRGDLYGGGALLDLRWESGYEPFLASYQEEHELTVENLHGHARWYRGPGARPVMICLHGLGGGNYFFEEKAFVAHYWYRIGIDPILFQLPFHGHRRPLTGKRAQAIFPSPHVVRTNESFAHAIHDLEALIAWLRGRDVPAIGMMGMSLGGYTTALAASVIPDLAFAVPMIPAVSMSELMWRHGKNSPGRVRAERSGVTQDLLDRVFRVHAPLARRPLVPHDRRMLIAGKGDRITPPDQAEKLWEHWDRPAIHWFPGGHLAQVGRGQAFKKLRRFLHGHGLLSS